MARIRTIKPEFWQNEDLACISLHARLLAIALLNYADDSGYFQANPALVRAACFPFDDDSTNTRRSLDELSEIGYIQLKDCSGKHIGKVLTFSLHQRIDRPVKSKIADLFDSHESAKTLVESGKKDTRRQLVEDSTNTRRILDEDSSTGKEQGKERNREKETETEADYAQAREIDVEDFFEEKKEFDFELKIPDGIPSTPGGAPATPWDEKPVKQLLQELQEDMQFIESLERMYKIDRSIIPEWMDAYELWKCARDGPVARLRDVRTHFLHWLRGRDLTKKAKVFKDESTSNPDRGIDKDDC
jgi:hypothetical protein